MLTVTLKNNGDRTAILDQIKVEVVGVAHLADYSKQRFRLTEVSWTYDHDIDSDEPIPGRHHLEPNEVEMFEISIGRQGGLPYLSVYRIVLVFKFDEGELLRSNPVNIEMIGPRVALGMRSVGQSEDVFCSNTYDKFKEFDLLEYDLRPHLPQSTLELMRKHGYKV